MAVALCMIFAGSGALRAAPGNNTYKERQEEVRLPNRSLHLRWARPEIPSAPTFLVAFATSDGGLHGGSKAIYKHLAQQGYYVAAVSSREVLKSVRSSGKLITFPEATADIEAFIREAKRLLRLPESTPTIVTGLSRGASIVVLAAGDPSLQRYICGAVAIALTRETDYVKPPEPAQRAVSIRLDEKGGILLYPALDRLGSIPIAVIQSMHDDYVPSSESRSLMGPDTPARRLYEIPASDHAFTGGRSQMLRAVDDALSWITAAAAGSSSR